VVTELETIRTCPKVYRYDSWGGIYLEMDKSVCLLMIYTNDYFTGS
jgi:hypothetical protein